MPAGFIWTTIREIEVLSSGSTQFGVGSYVRHEFYTLWRTEKLRTYKPIHSKTVAKAMVQLALQNTKAISIYQSNELFEIAKSNL